MRKTLVNLAITGSIVFSAAAGAAVQKTDSAVVDLAGINLDSRAGQQIAYVQLQRAARKVCGSTQLREAGSLSSVKEAKSCYSETLDSAVENLGIAAIEKLHAHSEG
ncbi:MAG: UrcA family protein [Pseudomonadales bacterium]|nr:UrcA family protein [Planctomycetaceae bacterium]MCB1644845.1 UrcA family protein [Pseudomonadales bacterium]